MSRKIMKGLSLAAFFLFAVTLFSSVAFAAQGDQVGGVEVQKSAGNDTEVWAGVTVDYMFPLRYEVYDENGLALADVSIEHYDYTQQEYVYVGRTNEQGVWETRVPAGYFNEVIIGGAQGISVADTRALYEDNEALKHRLSKDGFVIVEGDAVYTVESTEQGEPVIVIRITMQHDTPPDSGSSTPPDSGSSTPPTSGGSSTPPDTGSSKPNSPPNTTTSSKPTTSGGLPQTGVPAYWIFLGIGSLLLLIAALIICKILLDEKNQKKNQAKRGG